MSTLLQINTSLFSGHGQSTQLANEFVAQWRQQHPEGTVVIRDLSSSPVPHLDATRLTALSTPAEQRSAEQQAVVDFSDALIAELRAADIVVLGLPLYNFGIPSGLQSYFDHIARAGVTFKYTATGPEGFLGGKRVLIFATRGGKYINTAAESVTTQVRSLLSLLGMTDVEFIYAEGLNMGDEPRAASLQTARTQSTHLLQSFAG